MVWVIPPNDDAVGKVPPVGLSEIRAVNGLVHPHTQWFGQPEELISRWNDYSGFIERAAEDKTRALIFVGTATPDTPGKLKALDGETARLLTEKLPRMNDGEREGLLGRLRSRGVNIRDKARYTFLEELSLIRKAVASIEPSRLMYFESQVAEGEVKAALRGRIDARTVDVLFRGERHDVCVREQGLKVCRALELPDERLRILI